MTPYQSARVKKHSQFFHHVRQLKSKISARARAIETKGNCLDYPSTNCDEKARKETEGKTSVIAAMPTTQNSQLSEAMHHLFSRIEQSNQLLSVLDKLQKNLVIPNELSDQDLMTLSSIAASINSFKRQIEQRIVVLTTELNKRLESSLNDES